MRIGVNARFLLKNKLEGIGRFSHESLSRLVLAHPEHQFVFFFDRAFDQSFVYADNVIPVIAYPQARHPYLYYLWFEWSLPVLFRKYRVDLFLSPDGFLSKKSNVPSIPVIHDLAFEHFPGFVSKTGAAYYKSNFPVFCGNAARIATVSEFTKSDIISLYHIDPDKIDVVYNGASEIFQPLDAGIQKTVRDEYTGGKPFFLYVGALHPRKNIGNLLLAFDSFCAIEPGFRLLIAGRMAWQTEDIRQVYEQMKFRENVVFTGRLSDEELSRLMATAYALTYVPWFEGFGLPLVESFRCGKPAITSSVSSLPEVGGDAVLLADPSDPYEISQAMHKLVSDGELYKNLCDKALRRSSRYTWDKTASLLWNTVEKVGIERKLA